MDAPEKKTHRTVRLTRAVTASGLLSRRAAETAIRAGRVSVGGAPWCDPFAGVEDGVPVALDGVPLPCAAEKVVFLLNKPSGFVCSRSDRSKRLAVSLLPETGRRLFSAGRLDAASEGMIVFTNDGALVHALEHPERGVEKHYLVTTARPLRPDALAALRAGVEENGETLRPVRLEELGGREYLFVLNEGKRHEIRRMVQHAKTTVKRLRRIRIGALDMGDLPPGAYRELTAEEVARLLS